MNGSAENVKSKPANEPEDEKNNRDGIKHTKESHPPA